MGFLSPLTDSVLHLVVEVVDDPEGGGVARAAAAVGEEGGGEAGEEDGGRRVGARREGEGDDRVRQVVVLLGVGHRRVVLKRSETLPFSLHPAVIIFVFGGTTSLLHVLALANFVAEVWAGQEIKGDKADEYHSRRTCM